MSTHATLSREQLLETCFSDMPVQVGEFRLRPLSPGSFTLLGRLGNVMMVGAGPDQPEPSQGDMLSAVIEYIWIHGADIDAVASISSRADLPENDIARLSLQITFGQALAFLERYKDCALRMTASLAEVEEDLEEQGKPAVAVPAHAGSLPWYLRSEEPGILSASATSSGLCPSNEPLPISMLPTCPTEHAVAGPAPSVPSPPFLMPDPSSLPSATNGIPA